MPPEKVNEPPLQRHEAEALLKKLIASHKTCIGPCALGQLWDEDAVMLLDVIYGPREEAAQPQSEDN